MTATAKRPPMTDAEITALVREHNPLIHGRRDTLLRQRAAMEKSPHTTPAQLAEIDAELAAWEARVTHYEDGARW